MARKSIEAERKAQREWRRLKRRTDPVWHAREKERKRKYGHPEYYARWHEERARENERRWRFMMRDVARLSRAIKQLTIVPSYELINPTFVFVHNGRKRREMLHEPFPAWSAEVCE